MDWLAWVWEQAKVASPFVTIFVMGVGGTVCRALWAQHLRDQKTLESIGKSQARAMLSVAKSISKLSARVGSGR